jgi:ADP-heptose:LPS heptosyltransferase
LTLIIEKRALECAGMIASPPWDELWVLEQGNKYFSALKMIRKMRSKGFDLVIGAKPRAMKLQSLMVGLSGAKSRRALCHKPKKGWEWAINEPVSLQKVTAFKHQSLQTMALLEDKPCRDPSYWPVFKSLEVPFSKRCTLYINLTNNRQSSMVDLEQMKAVFEKLKRPFLILLGGLSTQETLAESWKKVLMENELLDIELVLGDDFEKTCRSLYRSDLVITGDGGLMHMAAACKRPLLALFGQTSIERWHPLSCEAKVLFHPQKVSALDPQLLALSIETFIQEKGDALCRS